VISTLLKEASHDVILLPLSWKTLDFEKSSDHTFKSTMQSYTSLEQHTRHEFQCENPTSYAGPFDNHKVLVDLLFEQMFVQHRILHPQEVGTSENICHNKRI
jgi:hypothetical protein